MASTRFGWLQDLEAHSPTVAALNLTTQVSDEPYWDTVTNRAINADASTLTLQLPFPQVSESMGNHDSKIVGADSVD